MAEEVVLNLRESRREQRDLARELGETNGSVTVITEPGTKPEKAPAKVKRPPVSPDNPQYTRSKYEPQPGKKLYEATGGSGRIVVRSYAVPVTHGISVAEPNSNNELNRLGLVWALFPSLDAATKAADKLIEQGYQVDVVDAQPYRGQGEDELAS